MILNLSEAQQKSYSGINRAFTEKRLCLLHGITSSGKTQLYIKQIEKFINDGKQVLYLLPGNNTNGADYTQIAIEFSAETLPFIIQSLTTMKE